MEQRPKPEIVNGHKVVYPIWRDDLAEAIVFSARVAEPADAPVSKTGGKP